MTDIIQLKKDLLSEIEWSTDKPPEQVGGQSLGIVRNYPVILKHEVLSIKITIGYHTSQLKNKELALVLFELALDDIIK